MDLPCETYEVPVSYDECGEAPPTAYKWLDLASAAGCAGDTGFDEDVVDFFWRKYRKFRAARTGGSRPGTRTRGIRGLGADRRGPRVESSSADSRGLAWTRADSRGLADTRRKPHHHHSLVTDIQWLQKWLHLQQKLQVDRA